MTFAANKVAKLQKYSEFLFAFVCNKITSWYFICREVAYLLLELLFRILDLTHAEEIFSKKKSSRFCEVY
jgi:hypothetical protein